MKLSPNQRDVKAEWHWGVLGLVCAGFVSLGVLAAFRESWVALTLALVGLLIFGKSAWTKLRVTRDGIALPDPPAGELRANSLTPRTAALVAVLGLLIPLYFLLSAPLFRPSEMGDLFWTFLSLLWMLGFVIATVLVFLWKLLAPHFAAGWKRGRGVSSRGNP